MFLSLRLPGIITLTLLTRKPRHREMKELARVTELSRRGNRFEPRRVTSQPGFLASHASGSHARPNPLGGSCKLAGPSPHPGDSVWTLGCRTKQPGFCHAASVEQRGALPYSFIQHCIGESISAPTPLPLSHLESHFQGAVVSLLWQPLRLWWNLQKPDHSCCIQIFLQGQWFSEYT